MNWQQWLQGIGLSVPSSPNIDGIVLAVVLVAGAYWIGWFASNRLNERLTHGIMRWTGRTEGVSTALIGSVLQHGLATLLLLIASNAAPLSAIGTMIVAVALGAAVAMLLFRVGKAFGLGGVSSLVLACVALVAGTAAMLGGLRPLIAGLDGVGFSLGTHHLSLLGLVNFIVVAAILIALARIANRVLAHSVGHMQALDASQRVLVQKLGGIAVIVVAILLGIDLLGIDLTALTVFSGAFGLAVGFGLQKTFGNLIAGLILLMDRSIKPGDVIVVGDTFGAVGKIGVRAVSVVTRDGKEHLIPNEQLMTEAVENWSYSSRNVRVHIPVGVSYSSDLKVAQRLMVEAATAAARVLAEPKPSVWLKDFGDSSVDHDILVWISDPELGVGNVRSDILNRLWVLFAENGIELPFPQRDVTIRGLPPGAFQPPGGD
jgi:small-conductance mechanosensitive channel